MSRSVAHQVTTQMPLFPLEPCTDSLHWTTRLLQRLRNIGHIVVHIGGDMELQLTSQYSNLKVCLRNTCLEQMFMLTNEVRGSTLLLTPPYMCGCLDDLAQFVRQVIFATHSTTVKVLLYLDGREEVERA